MKKLITLLFQRTACPVKPKPLPSRLQLRHFVPLLGFVLPTIVIGYGFVIPKSCIAGLNELSIGFATTILGAAVTYVAGIRSVLRDAQNLSAGGSGAEHS